MPGEPTVVTEPPVQEEHKASSRDIRSSMDEFFEVERPQAPTVGKLPQFPDKTPLPETKDEPPKEEGKAPELKEPEGTEEKTETLEEKDSKRPGMTEAAPKTAEVVKPEVKTDDELVGDEELDKIQLRPNTKPEVKSQFKQLKILTKEARENAKKEAELRTQLEQTVQQLKTGGAAIQDPEVQARIKRADEILRTFDVQNYSEFQTKYTQPIQAKWKSVINTLSDIMGAEKDPKILEWVQHVEKLGPDHQGLSKEWWKEQLDKIPDEDDRSDLRAQLKDITFLRRDRDRYVKELGTDDERAKQFFEKQGQENTQKFWKQVNDAADKLYDELKIGDWGKPIDPATAKNDTDRAKIEEHNQRQLGYQKQFQEFLVKINTPGDEQAPTQTKLGMMAIKAIHQETEIGNLQKQLDESQKKIAQLETQLNKKFKVAAAPEKSNGAPTPRAAEPAPGRSGRPGENSSQRTKRAMDEFFQR
jgi:hypothetical protein